MRYTYGYDELSLALALCAGGMWLSRDDLLRL